MLLTPASFENETSARRAYVNRLDAKGTRRRREANVVTVFYRNRPEILGVQARFH